MNIHVRSGAFFPSNFVGGAFYWGSKIFGRETIGAGGRQIDVWPGLCAGAFLRPD